MQTTSLHELQAQFSECLFDIEKNSSLLPLKTQNPDNNEQRLNIYRNNVFYSLTSALADLYPVIKRLTGTDFFNGTAKSYLLEHPPKNAAMVYFAENFPDFLLNFKNTLDNPWLSDVARVDLAWHQSYHAADSAPLTPDQLAKIPADKLAQSKLALHPSVKLIQSAYPIFQIWDVNHSERETEDKIDLGSGEESLCSFRPVNDVIVRQLDTGSFTFLQQLQNGQPLSEAMLLASEENPEFEMDVCLARCLTDGIFQNITGETQ
ncbi:MAG: HvfC/BufC family peptide modification chaperone [Gammaproteobacteria bacterium]|jgi:hypothetical protein